MSLVKFTPKTPDRLIKTASDMAPAKLGHLNVLVDAINGINDGESEFDVISEKTAAAGVTIDGVLLKDGIVGKVTTAIATADGLTTGLLTGKSQFVTVTSANANNIIALPALSAAMIGTVIRGKVGANGFELRVAVADATVGKINNVTTNVEAAIPANVSFKVECISATEWILTTVTALGAVGTAIVPDAA